MNAKQFPRCRQKFLNKYMQEKQYFYPFNFYDKHS